MKVSWLILTMNRADIVRKSVRHNWAYCGEKPDEIIWVDNGSTDNTVELAKSFSPDVLILNRENRGVARGYNQAVAAATGSHFVITGCDMLMPNNWLSTFKEYVKKIPGTGVACMYSKPLQECNERSMTMPAWTPHVAFTSALTYLPALPIERRIFSRTVLNGAGYLREDFGLYGWEDVEWAHRVSRFCLSQALLTYVIPGQVPEHLGTEGAISYDGKDSKAYHEFKEKEVRHPDKARLMQWCRENGYPYYNPFI